jgi:hypothetical protein
MDRGHVEDADAFADGAAAELVGALQVAFAAVVEEAGQGRGVVVGQGARRRVHNAAPR